MRLAVIGFGNAGSKIADRLLEYQETTGRTLVRDAVAVNTAMTDLEKLEYIPEDRRLLIGQTHELVRGHGAGADPDLGAEVARSDHREIERELSEVPVYDIDAFLVVAGLGGGTGSGGAPVLGENLRESYDIPVYGLGILPSQDEGGRATLNAARAFRSFANATDNLLLFDNDEWRRTDESLEMGYEGTNTEMVKRIGGLLSAGELDGSMVSENAMDSSDIRRTLSTGGVSTVAYAETGLSRKTRSEQGLLSRFSVDGREADNDGADQATKVNGLVRQAVQGRLTCPANVSSTERSLIVVSGPPRELSRKGLRRARKWLEDETGSVEVLAGDDPRESADSLSAIVLMSNVTDVTRVDRLQKLAVNAKENVKQQESARKEAIEELITDEHDRLDPV